MLHLHKDLEIRRDHTGKSQSVIVSCKCYSDYVTKTVSFPESGDPDIPEPTVVSKSWGSNFFKIRYGARRKTRKFF